jgi:hypothetical protein
MVQITDALLSAERALAHVRAAAYNDATIAQRERDAEAAKKAAESTERHLRAAERLWLLEQTPTARELDVLGQGGVNPFTGALIGSSPSPSAGAEKRANAPPTVNLEAMELYRTRSAQIAEEVTASWTSAASSISSAMTSAFLALARGAASLGDVMVSMAGMVLQMLSQIATQKVVQAILAHNLERPVKVADVVSAAGVAGANAATSAAFAGPVAAAAAAATTAAAVMESMMPLATAARGFDVPAGATPWTMLHPREMVLPADIAQPLREWARSGGSRGTSIVIQAMDARSVERSLRDNERGLGRVLRDMQRHGRL